MNREIVSIVDDVILKLKSEGFILQRYDAVSTDSIYLKLDFGVCNSIRFSNHRGKKHLHYRYNLIFGGKTEVIFNKFPMNFFSEKDVDNLIEKVLSDREEKINKYGLSRYKSFMEENKTSHKDDLGFWKEAYLVD